MEVRITDEVRPRIDSTPPQFPGRWVSNMPRLTHGFLIPHNYPGVLELVTKREYDFPGSPAATPAPSDRTLVTPPAPSAGGYWLTDLIGGTLVSRGWSSGAYPDWLDAIFANPQNLANYVAVPGSAFRGQSPYTNASALYGTSAFTRDLVLKQSVLVKRGGATRIQHVQLPYLTVVNVPPESPNPTWARSGGTWSKTSDPPNLAADGDPGDPMLQWGPFNTSETIGTIDGTQGLAAPFADADGLVTSAEFVAECRTRTINVGGGGTRIAVGLMKWPEAMRAMRVTCRRTDTSYYPPLTPYNALTKERVVCLWRPAGEWKFYGPGTTAPTMGSWCMSGCDEVARSWAHRHSRDETSGHGWTFGGAAGADYLPPGVGAVNIVQDDSYDLALTNAPAPGQLVWVAFSVVTYQIAGSPGRERPWWYHRPAQVGFYPDAATVPFYIPAIGD